MKKYLFILTLLLLITGCGEKEISQNIMMDCNGELTTHEVKKGTVLGCKLLGEKYELTITSVTDEKIKVKVNGYGLTDTNSLLDKKNSFEFNKDKELKLKTQSTDYQEKVILSYYIDVKNAPK